MIKHINILIMEGINGQESRQLGCFTCKAAQERHRQSVRCLRQLIRERQQLLRHQKILAAGGGELSFRGSHTISESSVSSSSSSGSSAFSERGLFCFTSTNIIRINKIWLFLRLL